MANFGPLTAEIGLPVWGSPANFNGFRILHSLLQRHRTLEANQTLHYVWPSPELVHYIYIFGGSCPLTEICPVQDSLYVQVLRSPILATLLHALHSSSGRQPNFAAWYIQRMELRNFRRGRHLYPAGRPSRWALAHILVMAALCNRAGHYIFALWFLSIFYLLLSFFPRLISAATAWMSTILLHMAWP